MNALGGRWGLGAPGYREQGGPFEPNAPFLLPVSFCTLENGLFDELPNLSRLHLYQHRRAYRASVEEVEDRCWCVTGPDKDHSLEAGLGETRGEQGGSAFVFVPKPEHWRSRWQLRLHVGVRLHCLCDKCEEITIRGPGSHGKAPATRLQHTGDFGQHALRLLHVQHAKAAGDDIYARICERDCLGVADPEVKARVAPVCLGNHRRSEIHSDDLSSTPSRFGGKGPSAARDVQKATMAERDAAVSARDAVTAERDALLEHNERLHHLLLKLAHAVRHKSERLPEDRLQLGLEDLEQAIAKGEAEAEKRDPELRDDRAAKRRVNRGSLPAHLPRIEVT